MSRLAIICSVLFVSVSMAHASTQPSSHHHRHHHHYHHHSHPIHSASATTHHSMHATSVAYHEVAHTQPASPKPLPR